MYPVAACVTGKGGVPDKTGPRIKSADVSPEGDVLTVYFNEPLDQTHYDQAWVLVDSETNESSFLFTEFTTPTQATFGITSGTIPPQPATLSILEINSTPDGPFRDLRGNLLPDPSGTAVTNNVPVP